MSCPHEYLEGYGQYTDLPRVFAIVSNLLSVAHCLLSNEPHRLARYAGYAKGVLAGGLCVVFGTEAASLAQLKVLGFSLALQFSGLFCLLYVCWKYVETTNYLREDGVVAPLAVEKIMLQDVKGVEVRLNEDTHEPEVVQVGTGEVEEVEKEKRHIHTPSTEA